MTRPRKTYPRRKRAVQSRPRTALVLQPLAFAYWRIYPNGNTPRIRDAGLPTRQPLEDELLSPISSMAYQYSRSSPSAIRTVTALQVQDTTLAHLLLNRNQSPITWCSLSSELWIL